MAHDKKPEEVLYASWLKYWDKPDTNWKNLAKGMAVEFFRVRSEKIALEAQA